MPKIEDIKIKNYQEIFQRSRRKTSLASRLVERPFFNSFKLNSIFQIISFLFIFILSFNVVAAPLNLPVSKSLDPETQKKKESLEAELQKVLKQIEEYKKTITNIQKQKRSIQNDLKIVESNIKKVELEIKAIDLSIKRLNQKIAETKKSIQITEEKIDRSKEILTAALRYYYQLRQRSVVEVFLASAQLSDYFNNFFYLQKLQEQINTEIDNLKDLNQKLNQQKIKLENELQEQSDLLSLQKIKYAELQDLKKEKQNLLAQTSKQESQYKQLLKESEKTAAQIREQIYRLAGGSGPITFGEAYNLAKIAEKYTGIRPAFLLAILHYESRLGQNVGTCHYKNAMKPSEWPIFEKIVSELGLDPNRMPVSCKPWYGWGGAMGPAQFIPSTWMAYKDRVSKITGNNPPSPWNNLDAFVAAAIKLTDSGANSRKYQDEWKSAMIYFAGSNWNNPSLRFYGDDVMAIAERFQRDIEILEKGQ
jgi:membrane-bound lytic murein transglycosylase B